MYDPAARLNRNSKICPKELIELSNLFFFIKKKKILVVPFCATTISYRVDCCGRLEQSQSNNSSFSLGIRPICQNLSRNPIWLAASSCQENKYKIILLFSMSRGTPVDYDSCQGSTVASAMALAVWRCASLIMVMSGS